MREADQATRYELLERIGAGGMAEVFRARVVGAAGFAKVVAVKRILPTCSSDGDFVKRFVDEARLTARLQHPNICQVLDFGVMDGRYFIAMEHVEGLDLAKALAALERRDEVLAPDLCLGVLAGVLRGLGHAHRATDEEGRGLGIIHRDVSPHNVLLSVNGDVKLSDFGAAKAAEGLRQAHTMDNFALGKLLYMAPEQRRGQHVDERTDVYGAGVLLAEMILGTSAFRRAIGELAIDDALLAGPVAARFPRAVSNRVATIVGRAIHTRPGVRYSDAISMLVDVETCCREIAVGSMSDRIAELVRTLRGEDGAGSARSPLLARARAATALRSPTTDELPPCDSGGQLVEDLVTFVRGSGAEPVDELPTFVRGPGAEPVDELPTSARGSGAEPVDELPTFVRGSVELLTEDLLTEVRGSGEHPADDRETVVRVGPAPLEAGGIEDLETRVVREPRAGAGADQGRSRRSDRFELLETAVRGSGAAEDPPTIVRPARDELPTIVRPPLGPEEDETFPMDGRPSPAPAGAPRGGSPDGGRRAGAPAAPPWSRPPTAARSAAGSAPPWLQPAPGAEEPKEAGAAAAPRARARSEETALVRVPPRRAGKVRLAILGLLVVTLGALALAWAVSSWTEAPARAPYPPERPGQREPSVGTPGSARAGATAPEGDRAGLAPGAIDPVPRPDPPSDPLGPDRLAEPVPAPAEETRPPRDPRPRETGRDREPRTARTGKATLTIVSEPPGRAYVDGRLVSPRTPVGNLEVAPGAHQVMVVFGSTRESVTRSVQVRAGEHQVVRISRGR